MKQPRFSPSLLALTCTLLLLAAPTFQAALEMKSLTSKSTRGSFNTTSYYSTCQNTAATVDKKCLMTLNGMKQSGSLIDSGISVSGTPLVTHLSDRAIYLIFNSTVS